MCTVSFVYSNGKTIITSNRDEKVLRESAIEPKNYLVNNKNILFPKDPKAGGTWFAIDENANVLVLLNGADEKHTVHLPYRKSRGLIVLDIISSISPKDFWNEIDLENIEPFTLVLFQNSQLFQLRWNGNEKNTLVLDECKNHVWSSSTLYSKEIREKRSKWFYSFLERISIPSEIEMFDFHRNTEKENTENGLVINRKEEMKTLSITQTTFEKNKGSISHHDLITNLSFETTFLIL